MTEVVVAAPARLHFGMIDPAGLGMRRFGGFGVGVESPRVVVAARHAPAPGPAAARNPAPGVTVSGPQADRAREAAQGATAAFGLSDGVEIEVREIIPPHVGLGSGTKLGLAVARAVAELAGAAPGPERLAEASGRGARSSVGSWTFAEPGLVVEAGVAGEGALSPLIARYPMPERWRCVLALPLGVEGLSGVAEERFFHALAASGITAATEPAEPAVARLLVSALLPGLLAADIEEFGAALTEIQRQVGTIFATQQGGVFHPRAAPIVRALQDLGVTAMGQSSWGPSAYGIVDGQPAAERVAERLHDSFDEDAEITVVDFDRHGAQVTRDGRIGATA